MIRSKASVVVLVIIVSVGLLFTPTPSHGASCSVSSDCYNGAECDNTTGTCMCNFPFYGSLCRSVNMTDCRLFGCYNNGTCVRKVTSGNTTTTVAYNASSTFVATDSYSCSCLSTYTGDHCQTALVTTVTKTVKQCGATSTKYFFLMDLSIAWLLIIGKLGGCMSQVLGLPNVLGMQLAGSGLVYFMEPGFKDGCGISGGYTAASQLKTLCLVILLMRAGIGLKPKEIYQSGVKTASLALLPYSGEIIVSVAAISWQYPSWPFLDCCLFACLMTPLSPAVVIPWMLRMIDQDNLYDLPKRVLMAAPLEVVLALIMFNVFSALEQGSEIPVYGQILLIPVSIVFSAIIGFVAGGLVCLWIRWRTESLPVHVKNNSEKSFVGRISRMMARGFHATDVEFLFVLVAVSLFLYGICVKQYIPQSSGVLGIFAACLTVSHFEPRAAAAFKVMMGGIWIWGECLLFTISGLSLKWQGGLGQDKFAQILWIETCGRGFGVLLACIISRPWMPKYQRGVAYTIQSASVIWVFTIPKATIQASLGSAPLQQHIIPGDIGLDHGAVIAAGTAFAVLMMAPVGEILTQVAFRPLAFHLQSWSEEQAKKEKEKEMAAATTASKDGAPGSGGPGTSPGATVAVGVDTTKAPGGGTLTVHTSAPSSTGASTEPVSPTSPDAKSTGTFAPLSDAPPSPEPTSTTTVTTTTTPDPSSSVTAPSLLTTTTTTTTTSQEIDSKRAAAVQKSVGIAPTQISVELTRIESKSNLHGGMGLGDTGGVGPQGTRTTRAPTGTSMPPDFNRTGSMPRRPRGMSEAGDVSGVSIHGDEGGVVLRRRRAQTIDQPTPPPSADDVVFDSHTDVIVRLNDRAAMVVRQPSNPDPEVSRLYGFI